MKVLIICSGNVKNFNFPLHQSFIFEQIESVKKKYNIKYDTYFIKGKGVFGYLKNISELKKKINEFRPDILHAHYGLSGILALITTKKSIVITFHGSDYYIKLGNYRIVFISWLASILAEYNIYVNKNINWIFKFQRYNIIPCGLFTELFQPVSKDLAIELLHFNRNKKYILFSSSFNNEIKNFTLAQKAVSLLVNSNVEIIELDGFTREQVNLLMNAVELLIVTSISESGPLVVKEAMACNCPIVATDVGDIKDVIGDTDGCYITTFDPIDISNKIQKALDFAKKNNRTNGRERILQFDNFLIAEKIYKTYQIVLESKIN